MSLLPAGQGLGSFSIINELEMLSWFLAGQDLNILNGRCARSISSLFGNLVGRQSASLGIRMGARQVGNHFLKIDLMKDN